MLLWIHSFASDPLDLVFEFSHQLGAPLFCAILVAVTVGGLYRAKLKDEAALWLIISGTTWVLQYGLKRVIARPRPSLWQGPVHHSSFAMPSGHALAAATFFVLLARIAANRWPRYKHAAYAWGMAMAFYVGFGRLYLGVHWPTDVLAGWMIGAAQTYLAIRILERRRMQA